MGKCFEGSSPRKRQDMALAASDLGLRLAAPDWVLVKNLV